MKSLANFAALEVVNAEQIKGGTGCSYSPPVYTPPSPPVCYTPIVPVCYVCTPINIVTTTKKTKKTSKTKKKKK